MADFFYHKARERFATAALSWTAHDIKVVLVDTADYTPVQATDEFLADIPVAARVGTSGNLTGKTATDGVLDADDVTVTSVTGDQFEGYVLYRDTGSAATSPLILYKDSAAELPMTPNGGNITINWSNGASRIAVL